MARKSIMKLGAAVVPLWLLSTSQKKVHNSIIIAIVTEKSKSIESVDKQRNK